MEKCLLHQALRLGDPLIKLLELRFVSSSSETSRSSGTIQTSQSSISSHPAFPDVPPSSIHLLCSGCPLQPSSPYSSPSTLHFVLQNGKHYPPGPSHYAGSIWFL